MLAWIFAIPRFHLGRPENPGELHFWQEREAGPAVFQKLRLKWWCGLSSRRRPKWFLGVMAWDKKSDF
jgi:hypothetical protein